MKKGTQGFLLALVAALMVAQTASPTTPVIATAPMAQGNPFADPAFQRVWERTDTPVAQGKVKRSFYWGPQANTGPIQETYAEGAGSKHLVQYFDKGRMEINDPGADKNNPFYVTPGRLTVEMVKSAIQVSKYKYKYLYTPYIPIAGDADDTIGPTYANFINFGPRVEFPNAHLWQDLVGKKVISFVSRQKGFGENAGYGASGIKYVYYEPATGWNIPDVFWQYLNQEGLVLRNGSAENARLSDPYFYVTGYPISNAYWSWAKIGGKPNVDVLIQLYERRVLTYVPSAPDGFKVQMGNIGQHYYSWRYQGAGKPPPIECKSPQPPANRFTTLWQGDTTFQPTLSCPLVMPSTVAMSIQHFEHGLMVYVDYKGVYYPYESNPRKIYVLYEDGSSESFIDYYFGDQYEPTPPPLPTPPAGLQAPRLGFGKVWREKANVRQLLGFATAPEIAVERDNFQFFRVGYMVSDGKMIYTFPSFSSDTTGADVVIYDWHTFPDPQPPK
jgi:hypothetical protein